MEHNLGDSEFGYCVHFNCSLYQSPSLFFMHNSVKDGTVYVVPNYRMAGNFGGKIFWRIAENMSFGGIYFGG